MLTYIIGVDVSGDECLEMMSNDIHKNPHTLHQFESVLTEAEAQGCRDLLEGIWVTDTSNLSERIQFFEDQFTNSICNIIMQWLHIIMSYMCVLFSNGKEKIGKMMEHGDFSYW